MSESSTATILPRSFWIISMLALAWNLMGVASYLLTVTVSTEALNFYQLRLN